MAGFDTSGDLDTLDSTSGFDLLNGDVKILLLGPEKLQGLLLTFHLGSLAVFEVLCPVGYLELDVSVSCRLGLHDTLLLE